MSSGPSKELQRVDDRTGKGSFLKFGQRALLRTLFLWVPVGSLAFADMIDTSGMEPWEVCALCHSLDGISVMAKFPKLAGQRAAYIEKQFQDFHSGSRSNDGGQMQAITLEVNDSDLSSIAAYFENLPAPPAAESFPEADIAIGRDLFQSGNQMVPPCKTCHGSTGSDVPLAPWLEAQHKTYLVKQLQDFREGRRQNDPGAVMQSVAGSLTEHEITALADFLATQSRPERKP
ncbi:MAG: c-type cytochrome [Roseibium sp.]